MHIFIVDIKKTLWEFAVSVLRYGGLSVGGQLPILDVNPKDIQDFFKELGGMLNITGVFTDFKLMTHES